MIRTFLKESYCMSISTSMKNIGKLSLGFALVWSALPAQQAVAHGYIDGPIMGRALACYTRVNDGCVEPYEPQGVEWGGGGSAFGVLPPGNDAFPHTAPVDGQIAAGGLDSKYSNLNVQTATRWHKNKINPGKNTFNWTYTAAHPTAYWEFFITKKGWNPNQPLTRASFDATPIALELGDGSKADSKMGKDSKKSTHTVNVPSDHTGYHVILATWKVADTSATFYQVIDVDIAGKVAPVVPSLWTEIGKIQPSETALKAGDTVTARVMTSAGEDVSKKTVLTIQSDDEGKTEQWPQALATKINEADLGFKAGRLNGDDKVVPVSGTNFAYIHKGSNVTGLIIGVERMSPSFSMEVSGIKPSYQANNGKVELHFDVKALGEASTVTNIVFNSKKQEVARSTQEVNDGSVHFPMTIENAVAGTYDLTTIAKSASGTEVQKTSSFKVTADSVKPVDPVKPGTYDFTYPDNIDSYVAGSTVLQPESGNIYQCKAFPASGWCKQSPTAYAPGTGSHWKDAWDLVSGTDVTPLVPIVPADPTDVPSTGTESWSSATTYATPGTIISWKGKNYQNGWYTKGEEPGTTGEWGVWRISK